MPKRNENKTTATQLQVRLEQFLIKPQTGREVIVTNNPSCSLQDASEGVVGAHGADRAIVWVLLDVNDDHHHVVLDEHRDARGLEVLDVAIAQLTLVREQLMRLQAA